MTRSLTVKLPGKSPVTLTAGAFCSPCEAQKLQAQTAAVQKTYQNNEGAYVGDRAWSGELGYESEFTGDGRYINDGALYFDDSQLPMPLRYAQEDVGAHGGAQVIGLIETLSVEKGIVKATGIIDGSTELGALVIAGMEKGTIKGVSLDLDDFEMELRLKKEVYDEQKAAVAAFMDSITEGKEPKEEKPDVNDDGYVKVAEYKADDEVAYITKARVRAATLVDIPAFANAYVALDVAEAEEEGTERKALAASAPVNPPSEWFESSLQGPTPLTFTDDGRVFGHIGLWGTCHTGYSQTCVTLPYSSVNYAWFRTGALHTDDGKELAVGQITLSTGHADMALSAASTKAHYDDTGTCVADVVTGEDAYGVYVAGALRPGLSAETMRELRAAPMSGDWRDVAGNLELVGILGVNIPGFMVPRTKALVASGRTNALIIPVPETEIAEDIKPPSAVEDFAATALRLTISKWAAEVGE